MSIEARGEISVDLSSLPISILVHAADFVHEEAAIFRGDLTIYQDYTQLQA